MTIDARLADAFARLPDYLGSHVLVSITALALGLGISLPLAIASRQRPVLRAALLGSPAWCRPFPAWRCSRCSIRCCWRSPRCRERLFGKGFSALGFLPSVLALALYSMLPVLRNTVIGLNGVDRSLRRGRRASSAPDRPRSLVGHRTAAGHAGDHGRHPHRGGVGDRHRHAVDADRADQPRQLHLRRPADAELGVRAVRLRRRRGAGAGRRSVAGVDGARRRNAQPRRDRRRRRRAGADRARRTAARHRPRASDLRHRRQAVHRAIRAGRADRAAARGARLLGASSRDGLGSGVIFNALAAGDIDAYVDYSGTIWANEMHRSDVKPRAEVLAEVSRWLESDARHPPARPARLRERLCAGDAARARRKARHPLHRRPRRARAELSIAGDYEFFERPEWKAIRDAYGLRFRAQRTMQPDFMYQAAAAGDVDVVSAYTSDGRIAQYDLDGARRSQARHPAL